MSHNREEVFDSALSSPLLREKAGSKSITIVVFSGTSCRETRTAGLSVGLKPVAFAIDNLHVGWRNPAVFFHQFSVR